MKALIALLVIAALTTSAFCFGRAHFFGEAGAIGGGAAGTAIGSSFGGPIGGMIGGSIGSSVGGKLGTMAQQKTSKMSASFSKTSIGKKMGGVMKRF